jgi:hypothetical protein
VQHAAAGSRTGANGHTPGSSPAPQATPHDGCPTKGKQPCPLGPKHTAKCIKARCGKDGFGHVTVGNCFGSRVDKLLAEYTNSYGERTCGKHRFPMECGVLLYLRHTL